MLSEFFCDNDVVSMLRVGDCDRGVMTGELETGDWLALFMIFMNRCLTLIAPVLAMAAIGRTGWLTVRTPLIKSPSSSSSSSSICPANHML